MPIALSRSSQAWDAPQAAATGAMTLLQACALVANDHPVSCDYDQKQGAHHNPKVRYRPAQLLQRQWDPVARHGVSGGAAFFFC